jgi:hypothetical protein
MLSPACHWAASPVNGSDPGVRAGVQQVKTATILRVRGTLISMRKHLVVLALSAGFLVIWSHNARAQEVTITNLTLSPEFVQATGMGSQEAVQAFIQQKIGEVFQTADAPGFLRKLGDSQSFTSKGIGVDYASEATYFEVGGAVNFAMGVDRTYQPSNVEGFPIQGVGLNASAMAGLSLEFLGLPVMIFGNYMKVPTMNYGSMSGSLDNWGVHAQLRLFGPSHKNSAFNMLLRWGGIAITTGIDSSHMALGLHKNIKSNFAFPGAPQTALGVTATADNQAKFNLDMTTRSIPLEVTTSLRLLTFVTAYGGLGFDWQLGGASKMDLAINAAMTGRFVDPNTQTTVSQNLGNATVTAKVSADPSPARIRGIVGAQFNLFLLRVFTQVNMTSGNPMMASLAAGLRLAY